MLASSKPLILCSAIGAPGGGVGLYGVYCWYDVSYPSNNTNLTKEGYVWNIPDPKTGATAEDPTKVFQRKEPFGCFQNFFPGATAYRRTDSDKEEDSTSDFPTLSDIDVNASSSTDSIGCSLIDFSFKKKVNNQKDHWAFNFEVTIRNENFGWALWASGRQLNGNESSTISTSVLYSLILLKKDQSNWNVIGGYSWTDYGSSSGESYHIKAPSAKGYGADWFDEGRNLSDGTSLHKQYSGIWTKDPNGKGVLEEIELYGGNNKNDSVEILGIPSSGFDCCNYCSRGYCGVTRAWKNESTKWMNYSKGFGTDISSDLKKFYKPFEDKKGKWTEFSEVQSKCNQLYYSRSNSGEELNYLKSFCYRKAN